MPNFEIYPMLDTFRALLVAVATAYLIYAIEGFVLLDRKSKSDSRGVLRIGLAISMFCFSMIQFLFTFSFGSIDRNQIIIPVFYIIGAFNFYTYCKLLTNFMLGARWIIPLVSIATAFTLILSIISIIYSTIYGESIGWQFYKDESISNSLVLATFGPYTYKPVGLGLIITSIAIVISLVSFAGMIGGIIKGLNRDVFIIFGVLFSLTAMVLEVTVPLISYDHIFLMYFASNLPELMRVGYLARRKLMEQALKKERDTVISLTATLNHELNTPLSPY